MMPRRYLCYLLWVPLFAFIAPMMAFDAADVARLKSQKSCNGCDLRGADLRGRVFVGAKLHWSRLEKADLRGVDVGASLSQARLMGADLRWADLNHRDADTDLEFVALVVIC